MIPYPIVNCLKATPIIVVCYTAVFSVVTQRSSPLQSGTYIYIYISVNHPPPPPTPGLVADLH